MQSSPRRDSVNQEAVPRRSIWSSQLLLLSVVAVSHLTSRSTRSLHQRRRNACCMNDNLSDARDSNSGDDGQPGPGIVAARLRIEFPESCLQKSCRPCPSRAGAFPICGEGPERGVRAGARGTSISSPSRRICSPRRVTSSIDRSHPY